jgi:environmental stress-induced protein Ves
VTTSLISVATVVPQAWRNGGGQTRELLVWPAQGPWRLRISRADIGADGPFSAFAGVTRWFAVLRGHGVALTMQGQRREMRISDNALRFDGALAPECELLDGPTEDLNLMAIGGDSVMHKVTADMPWDPDLPMRGLYTTVGGLWQSPHHTCTIDPHTLLWEPDSTPGAWRFAPAAGSNASAWWLGYCAKD